jgi:hypothetical protein
VAAIVALWLAPNNSLPPEWKAWDAYTL